MKAEKDNSYGTLNSNSVSQFNTALNQVPVSADIFTEAFMRDIGATSVEQMLLAYGAGGGSFMSNPSGDIISQQPGDRVGNQTMGVRGTSVGYPHRDGFVTVGGSNSGTTAVGYSSTFDTERAEVIRGPQGLLYGASGAGGTVNIVSKRAKFGVQSGSSTYLVDQYGSKNAQFDYNWGTDKVAVRFALLDEVQKYRRVFIGWDTVGYYAQLAFKFDRLHTVLRLLTQGTVNERIRPTNQENINFTNTATDPRHNFGLAYMLHNNLAGSINPATGQPWPKGPIIADGVLTFDNINSWGGRGNREYVADKINSAVAETVWTRWLSSQFAVLYNDYKEDSASGGGSSLSAPLLNGNPLNVWANSMGLNDTEQPLRRWAVRGSAMLTGDFFRDQAKTQTLIGYDIEWADSGPTDYGFFLADSNFNVIYNPAISTNLGRTPMPVMWWPVGTSPVKSPYPNPGWLTSRITQASGLNYVRMVNNPRDPAWIRANNPLGLASLAGLTGVSGQNNFGGQWEQRTNGYYASNSTNWFNDRIGTLVGARVNETYKRTPNITASVPLPWVVTNQRTLSYNLGVNVRALDWLRPYVSLSSTYNTPNVNANDPLGNAPRTSSGIGKEVGLKFNSLDGRISGSFDYYSTNSKDEMINAGTGPRDLINPTGLNGAYNGPAGAKNQWVNLDRTTKGLELILTASLTPNWRLRLAATSSDGSNLTDKAYPMLWNDQFYVKNDTVTYKDGTPFLVPVDAPTIAARISSLSTNINPDTIQNQGTWQPLTIAMMNTPSNPYWAQPIDGNGTLTTGTNVRRVLQFFNGGAALTGVTGLKTSDIPYFWGDPNGTKGNLVVAKKGESTVGYAKYNFNLTNFYTFSGDNFLKGFGIGGTLAVGMQNRSFYYNAPG
ncbi:MAG: TonB-dependent receptor plug domain-containing protein, partial [Opitutaceae bacterium]